ncbi:SDR family NAD(P)-dependent oxidoreductase [Candidatus Poribacteria bacterium]
MYWTDKKVLVTGAGGFIGSHLVEKLVALDSDVRAFVRYNSRNDYGLIEVLPEDIQSEITIVVGDLRDSDSVNNAVKGVDIVLHLGASISIPYSYVSPNSYVATNIVGTMNVLNAVKEYSVQKMVHTSSSEVYGTALYVPIDEEHPLQAQSPYSASKIGADKLAESYHLSYGLPVTTVRPFNTYGPRQSSRAVIPTIITQALTRDEVHLGATTPTRDFSYVEDTASAFIKAAESPESVGQVMNFGSGKEIAIGDLASKIITLVGRDVRIMSDEDRIRPEKSEVNRLLADATKARELIGWEPQFSLTDGLRNVIYWISEHLDRYKTNVYNI